jgi:hypothetical protein
VICSVLTDPASTVPITSPTMVGGGEEAVLEDDYAYHKGEGALAYM